MCVGFVFCYKNVLWIYNKKYGIFFEFKLWELFKDRLEVVNK